MLVRAQLRKRGQERRHPRLLAGTEGGLPLLVFRGSCDVLRAKVSPPETWGRLLGGGAGEGHFWKQSASPVVFGWSC